MPDDELVISYTAYRSLECRSCKRHWPAEGRFAICPCCLAETYGTNSVNPMSWPEAIELAHHADFNWWLYEHLDEWVGFPENWEDPERPRSSVEPEQGDTVATLAPTDHIDYDR